MSFKDTMMNTCLRAAVALGYDAAQSSRNRRDLMYSRRTNRDEDRLVGRADLSMIRQKCLDLRRNNGLVNAICGTIRRNVVSTGINPQAKTSSEEWNQEAESFWNEWSKIADNRNRSHLSDIQRMICDSWLLSGDMAFILLDNGKIQPIEADRIETPEDRKSEGGIYNGIKVDSNGAPKAFYIFSRNADGVIDRASKDYEIVDASNIIHVNNPFRFDQIRGLPELTPVLDHIWDIKETQEATLAKAKLDANTGHIVTTEAGGVPVNTGDRYVSKGAGATAFEKFEMNRNYYLAKGEDVKSMASNTPNPQYLGFIEQNIRLVGACLGLPYEFIMFDFSKGNFANTKGALLQAYNTITQYQIRMQNQFLQRLWNWRISKAVKYGDISRPPVDSKGRSEFWKNIWQFPEFSWIDPQKETAADLQEYQMGATTLSAITRKKGRDFQDVASEKARDIATAQQVADETNKQYGTNLTWRDIINVETIANQQAKSSDTTQEPI